DVLGRRQHREHARRAGHRGGRAGGRPRAVVQRPPERGDGQQRERGGAGVSKYVDVGALWRVALLSLGFGAGVVTIYALGASSLARGATAAVGRATGTSERVAGYALGALCLLV